MNFNFENIFIIGNKITGTGDNVEYDLTCYENDEGELYLYIWDNEEDLIKWKDVNSIDTKHNLIAFDNFLTSFIFRETGLKWILLNSLSKMTDSEVSDKTKKEKLMLFSILGIKSILEFYASLQNNSFSKIVINELILNNPELPPSKFISIFSEKVEELGSSVNNLSISDRFEKDILLNHVILNDIKYYEDQEFIDVNLELFGHCFKVIDIEGNKEIKGIFDSTREIECRVTNENEAKESGYLAILSSPNNVTISYPYPTIDDITITPHASDTSYTTFLLSDENLNKLKQHFEEINNTINIIERNFYLEINQIVPSLLNNIDIVNMGVSFIKKIPIHFYTNIQYLTVIDYFIYMNNNLGRSLLLTPREMNEYYQDTLMNFAVDTSEEVSSYMDNYFNMFSQVLRDSFSVPDDKSILTTYVFIYSLVIDELSKQWDDEHKQIFHNIDNLTLGEAVEQYCKIETIDHKDNITIGKFIYYLINHQKFVKNNRNYFDCYNIFIPKFNKLMENKKYNNFVTQLKRPNNSVKSYSIDDVDLMNGLEFEIFIAELFLKMGFESEVTKASGDQGIDVLASKNGSTVGIQAKCYSSTVGNSAIQEAVAGMNHYRLDKAIVITNNFFTSSAQKLAQSNLIILWDRSILKEKINEFF